MRSLDEYQKSELEIRLKKSKDLSEWKWIFAMIGYDDGQSIEELADLLRVSTYTVESYLRDYILTRKLETTQEGAVNRN